MFQPVTEMFWASARAESVTVMEAFPTETVNRSPFCTPSAVKLTALPSVCTEKDALPCGDTAMSAGASEGNMFFTVKEMLSPISERTNGCPSKFSSPRKKP